MLLAVKLLELGLFRVVLVKFKDGHDLQADYELVLCLHCCIVDKVRPKQKINWHFLAQKDM